MNTVDCIKTRRSVRKFTEEKVPHEVLEQLVELSRWAPSWKNTQIARYVAVEDEALKSRIAEEATFGLAAHELGLGSVVLGIFDEKKLAELLELPEGMGVACLMPLGYPAEEPAAPKRKEVAELLTIK